MESNAARSPLVERDHLLVLAGYRPNPKRRSDHVGPALMGYLSWPAAVSLPSKARTKAAEASGGMNDRVTTAAAGRSPCRRAYE